MTVTVTVIAWALGSNVMRRPEPVSFGSVKWISPVPLAAIGGVVPFSSLAAFLSELSVFARVEESPILNSYLGNALSSSPTNCSRSEAGSGRNLFFNSVRMTALTRSTASGGWPAGGTLNGRKRLSPPTVASRPHCGGNRPCRRRPLSAIGTSTHPDRPRTCATSTAVGDSLVGSTATIQFAFRPAASLCRMREFRHRHADVFAAEELQAERYRRPRGGPLQTKRAFRRCRSSPRSPADRPAASRRADSFWPRPAAWATRLSAVAMGESSPRRWAAGFGGGAGGHGCRQEDEASSSPFSFSDGPVFVPLSCLSFSGPTWMSG